MLKYLIIAVCLLTLISCDKSLHQVSPGITTLDEVELISADTTYYKITVKDNSINIYSKDNKLLYKDCVSTYNNAIVIVNIAFILWIAVICLFCIISLMTLID